MKPVTRLLIAGAAVAGLAVAGSPALAASGPTPDARPLLKTTSHSTLAKSASTADAIRDTLSSKVQNSDSLIATTPLITSPDYDDTVSGAAAVVATSTATRVRFALESGSTVIAESTVDVVSGTATGTIDTFGAAGFVNLFAYDCTVSECSAVGSSIEVWVDNSAPVITSPVGGTTTAANSISATATAAGGSVAFLLDGNYVALAASAPYTASLSTAGLSSGTHSITAVQCNAAPNACDWSNPSAAVTFNLLGLHPKFVSIAPRFFSPNADGRQDTTVIKYALDQTSSTTLRIKTTGGGLVLGPRYLGSNRPKGTYSYTWSGRNNGNGIVANGTYVVEITTSGKIDGYSKAATVKSTVIADRSRPGIGSLTASSVYPYKDGFADTVKLRARASETLAAANAYIYDSKGRLIRTIAGGGRNAGVFDIAWNGRKGNGAVAAAGTYRFSIHAQDRAGNRTTSARGTVTVSSKRLVAHTNTRIVTPYASTKDASIGYCSAIAYPARPSWPGSLGYLSNYYCDGDGTTDDDVAVTLNGTTLPAAVKYGSVRVDTYGGGEYAGDQAALLMVDRNNSTGSSYGSSLSSTFGWHNGRAYSATSMLQGRAVNWIFGTVYGSWYDAVKFRIVWVSYTLQ